MFVKKINASVIELIDNAQTHFQCVLHLSAPIELESFIQPGMLIAVEDIYHTEKEERYCVLQVLSSFPANTERKKKDEQEITLQCKATPIGIELKVENTKKRGPVIDIITADVFPAFDAGAFALNDEMTMRIIHHLSPGSRTTDNGSRIDIGTYATNPDVAVGLDAATLLRGNIAIVSARPRARTTMTHSLIHALLTKKEYPLHIVYCDVNYQGTLSILPDVMQTENAHLLTLNDKFVPSSVFSMFKIPADRMLFKRAVYDYLDMMLLPSVLESRRKDFLYPIANIFRNNKLSIYRANEPTVDEFINDIRMDILDGVDSDVEELLAGLMKGIAENFKGEHFNDKNVRDMMDMIDETNQETKIHGARRSLSDLRNEIQTVFESLGKDLPSTARMTLSDVVNKLNDDTKSSLFVVQGQKPTDILRFVNSLTNKLVDERLRRLKVRVPVLFIFNNADEYFTKSTGSLRETGSERFMDILSALLFHGRRHGLGFCMSLESCASLDKNLASKIHSFFIGPIRYTDDLDALEKLLNISRSLFQPAVSYEDGRCLFTSSDSPYQRRVPIPCAMPTNLELIHTFLDDVLQKQEQMRKEGQLQDQHREISNETHRDKEPRDKEDSKQSSMQTGDTHPSSHDVQRHDHRGKRGGQNRFNKRRDRDQRLAEQQSGKSSRQQPEEKNFPSEISLSAGNEITASTQDQPLTIESRIRGGFDVEEDYASPDTNDAQPETSKSKIAADQASDGTKGKKKYGRKRGGHFTRSGNRHGRRPKNNQSPSDEPAGDVRQQKSDEES